MSWLISQALGEAFSAASSKERVPYAQLNVMPTPQLFWRNDKPMDTSRFSQFGVTLQLLTPDHTQELLTWFLAGFHVRTSVAQALGQELTEPNPVHGITSGTPFAYWLPNDGIGDSSPPSYCWKTAQCSLFGGLTEYSENWPRSGTMRNGMCSERITSAPRTDETESGYWPTPRANKTSEENEETWRIRNEVGKVSTPPLTHAVKMWPTPCSRDWKDSPGMSTEGINPDGSTRNRTDQLARAVYATPQSRDHRTGETSRQDRNQVNLNDQIGGQLNPNWVEWLMGWPIGWTDLRPLETDKFLQWQHSHIEPSAHDSNEPPAAIDL